MAYCCVPNCCSNAKKKIPGLSFHDIPADEELSKKWILVIRRDNWTPNTTSNYSKVCSKHFKETDFLEGKYRRLKKGVVPSVFECYPLYLQPKSTKERVSSSIKKRSLCSDTAPQKILKMSDGTRCVQQGDPQHTPSDPLPTSAEPLPTPLEPSSTLSEHPPVPSEPLPTSSRSSTARRATGIEPADWTGADSVEFEVVTPKCLEVPVDTVNQFLQDGVPTTKDQETHADCRTAPSSLVLERRKWKRKERDLKKQVERLRTTVDSYKEELRKLREDCHFADLSYIKEQAAEKQHSAIFLLEQISNFSRKRPCWSEETIRHSIVLRHLSTKLYEHIRKEGFLKLPCRNTLQNYLGIPSGETGFNGLIDARLKAETERLTTPQSRVCSLVCDEMRIKERLQYNKQQDSFVGHTEMGVANDASAEPLLANSLLCFVLNGLSTSFRIPVSYFFTKGLNGSQLATLLVFVMKNVEAAGFRILRLVTYNHKVNVSAMKILCGGFLTYRIEHPCNSERLLFLSFDYCHVLKNVRSQFLARDMGKNGEISSSRIKKIYDMQKNWTVKPVRFLSRKHVYPNNIEKMNVARAVEVLSTDVTVTLKYLKDQAGHCHNHSFADCGPSVTFMENMYRWFVLHDTSSKSQHIRQKFPDVRQYDDPEDPRLEWLETTLPLYLEDLSKRANTPHQFLSKETYEALLMTSYSTVACVRHLLTKEHFLFVLTRKFSSDCIESLFGTLRRALGCNDQLDVRSAMAGLEKILKTGIATAPASCNVAHDDAPPHLEGLRAVQPRPSQEQAVTISRDAAFILRRLRVSQVQARLPTLQLSATVHVGGYIARVVSEQMGCESCCTVTAKPRCNQPLQKLTHYQDRGGLLYPSDELLHVLDTLRAFVEVILKENPRLKNPLTVLLKAAVPAISSSPLLRCERSDDTDHRKRFCELVATRFMKPLLVNFAFMKTDKNDVYKAFATKPVSRKYVKL
uniref:Putative transposase protein n=2 Tax=Ixodes ricinus TaxID=34613 RepID=A0A147BB70_IXORI